CDFGPGRRRRVDHRLEHLCRGYHRFSEPVALMNYPLLYYWDKFEFELYPEVASCNHDPVRFPDDLLEIIDGLPLLYLRDNKYRVAVGLSSFSRRFYVVDFLDKGYRDYVDFVFHAELDVFLVIACYGWDADSESWEVDSFSRGQVAAVDDASFDLVSLGP